MTTQPVSLSAMRNPPPAPVPDVTMGFNSLASFELMQRAAKLLCSSTLVPTQYRAVIEKLDKYGNVKERKENPNALANAVVALNMAQRMGADPLMIMQHLYVIEGRPSWSSQFIVAAINGCGKFSPLRFTLRDLGSKEVEHVESFWENGQRQTRAIKVQVEDRECIAWALERETGDRLESPPVTLEMAVKEGWYTKNGSKWQTMPEVMLRYRTASFFGRLYAPELLMGLRTVEESQEIIEISPDGEVLSVTTETLRGDIKPAEAAPMETINQETGEITLRETATEGLAGNTTLEQSEASPDDPPTTAHSQTPAKPSSPKSSANSTRKPLPDPAKLKPFLAEINSKKSSQEIDQWRAKHHNRVANALGGPESEGFLQIMDYAEMKYREYFEAEQQQGSGE